MFTPLFPRDVNKRYRGYRVAVWLFAPVVLLKLGISLNSIFDGRAMASSGDGIPLDTGSVINLVLLAGMVVGLALSLRSRDNLEALE